MDALILLKTVAVDNPLPTAILLIVAVAAFLVAMRSKAMPNDDGQRSATDSNSLLPWLLDAISKNKMKSTIAAGATLVASIAFDAAKDIVKDEFKGMYRREYTADQKPSNQSAEALKEPPGPNQNRSVTSSIDHASQQDCVPEESASAAFKTLRTMPKSSRNERFAAVFAGRAICANGWSGRVGAPPRKDAATGEWIVLLGGGIELRSSDSVWGAVPDGQRLRYTGKLTTLVDQDTIRVDDAKLYQIVPPPPPPTPPEQKPSMFEKLFGATKASKQSAP